MSFISGDNLVKHISGKHINDYIKKGEQTREIIFSGLSKVF